MFTRIPGEVRSEDQDGEQDPPISPVPPGIALATEDGVLLADEDGHVLLIA